MFLSGKGSFCLTHPERMKKILNYKKTGTQHRVLGKRFLFDLTNLQFVKLQLGLTIFIRWIKTARPHTQTVSNKGKSKLHN